MPRLEFGWTCALLSPEGGVCVRWCNVVPFQAAGQEALALAADPPSLGIGGRPSHFGGEVGGEPAAASLPMPPRVLDAHVMKSKLLASPYAFLANMVRCRAKAVDAEFGTRFAPKLKEGARLGDGKARRVQTCGYYDAFSVYIGAPKPPFQWYVVSATAGTLRRAPQPRVRSPTDAIRPSGAGDRSPKRPRKYARRGSSEWFFKRCVIVRPPLSPLSTTPT